MRDARLYDTQHEIIRLNRSPGALSWSLKPTHPASKIKTVGGVLLGRRHTQDSRTAGQQQQHKTLVYQVGYPAGAAVLTTLPVLAVWAAEKNVHVEQPYVSWRSKKKTYTEPELLSCGELYRQPTATWDATPRTYVYPRRHSTVNRLGRCGRCRCLERRLFVVTAEPLRGTRGRSVPGLE